MKESDIQKYIIEYLSYYPKISPFVIHIPNESKRTLSYGSLLKKMGMKKGVSDLFIALPMHDFHGAFIEIKTIKGRLQPHQKKFLSLMNEKNYFTAVTKGLDETLNTIKWYTGI